MRAWWIAGAALAFCVGLGAAGTHAQQASSSAAAAKRPSGDALDLSATSVNVASPGIPVKIRIIRWSTDAERAPLIEALTAPPPRAGRPGGAGPERGGGARGARGAAPDGNAQAGGRAGGGRAAGGAAADGGRAAGGAARAGRAGGRGALVQRAPLTPVQVLAEAIGKAPTVGYIWTNDVTGYSIRYAWHAPISGTSGTRGGGHGGDRIILVTDRRLDMYAPEWKPAVGTEPADYEFTLLEIRLDARGTGVAKTSLTTKIAVDKDANTLALEDFAGTPALLQNIKHYQPSVTE